MSAFAIRTENLSKRYRLGARAGGTRYRTLRDEVSGLPRRFASRLARRLADSEDQPEDFYALRDVNFEINPGEVVGIIGRNGAGKSTLLKILSRITEPTSGRVEIEGRVASLLEVGTGFHPELTGRENIFLNGAILGMTRAEIKAKFDEIVAFAEVERFLDTPVKRYSSGMYVRLAFAVAAHLEPEILMVDEVLAVGDAEFQKKCLGKMNNVSKTEGRTVIFVSHNMAAVRALCQRCILLEKGHLKLHDSTANVIDAYASFSQIAEARHASVMFPKPNGRCSVWVERVTVLGSAGNPSTVLQMGDPVSFRVDFRAAAPVTRPILGYLVRSAQGENIVSANTYFQVSPEYSQPVLQGYILCNLGALPLMANEYSVSLWLCRDPHEQQHLEDAIRFEVQERDIWGTGRVPPRGVSTLWWPTDFQFLEQG